MVRRIDYDDYDYDDDNATQTTTDVPESARDRAQIEADAFFENSVKKACPEKKKKSAS